MAPRKHLPESSVKVSKPRSKRSLTEDRQRVAIKQDHEVAYWKKALNTTRDGLYEAVAAVGHMAKDIRTWFMSKSQ